MLANLLNVAGINHVITLDLHASQMQGFFKCPVDNLHAEPLIARWIRHNVHNWKEAVCVSKNAGGTKRVTSLADALKLNFGMVTTDKKRGGSNMTASMIMRRLDGFTHDHDLDSDVSKLQIGSEEYTIPPPKMRKPSLRRLETDPEAQMPDTAQKSETTPSRKGHSRQDSQSSPRKASGGPSQLRSAQGNSSASRSPLTSAHTSTPLIEEEAEYTDERAQEVTHGRLVSGHVVSDDYPSPAQSAMSSSIILDNPEEDPMAMSTASSYFNPEPHALGGTGDVGASSDDEEQALQNPGLEQMITLVGNVKNRTVFIVDDMIDKSGSWIAAAEAVVKRGGAKKVYCVATHGLFGGDALEELQECDCIDTILVTNSFPIPPEKVREAKKLVILDLSNLLAEAIRRNHYGESTSPLFQHIND